jgi:hypothetical protein
MLLLCVFQWALVLCFTFFFFFSVNHPVVHMRNKSQNHAWLTALSVTGPSSEALRLQISIAYSHSHLMLAKHLTSKSTRLRAGVAWSVFFRLITAVL